MFWGGLKISDHLQMIRKTGDCPDCLFPIMADRKLDRWGNHQDWIERKHNCEFIPQAIIDKLDIKKARKEAATLVKKYRVNSDDKIRMVVAPKVVDILMEGLCLTKNSDIWTDDKVFINWWNIGFPETEQVCSRSPDHYQLVKLAYSIVEELL